MQFLDKPGDIPRRTKSAVVSTASVLVQAVSLLDQQANAKLILMSNGIGPGKWPQKLKMMVNIKNCIYGLRGVVVNIVVESNLL